MWVTGFDKGSTWLYFLIIVCDLAAWVCEGNTFVCQSVRSMVQLSCTEIRFWKCSHSVIWCCRPFLIYVFGILSDFLQKNISRNTHCVGNEGFYWLLPALTAVTSCRQFWKLLLAVASFDSCCMLVPALTAVTSCCRQSQAANSFDSSHQL